MKNFIIVLTFLVIGVNVNSQESNELSIGDEVSHFSAFDDRGNVWKSSDLNSDFLVVYFYPAAMTGGCTMTSDPKLVLVTDLIEASVKEIGLKITSSDYIDNLING